ncbi:MAG: hypothetical protein AAGO57_00495 [Pseudomonadota bacterium]
MDANTPLEGGEEKLAIIESKIEHVLAAVDIVIEAFSAKMDEIAALDRPVTEAEVTKVISRLRDTYTTLVRERQKLEDKVYGKFGAFAAEPIDVHAARSEIGRILDRIRTQGDAGRVSEGAE